VTDYDPVNPPHYRRGPELEIGQCDTYGNLVTHFRETVQLGGILRMPLHCIDVMRHMKDPRLATAFKYIWRVAFGGKLGADDQRDIRSAIWYLQDFLDHPVGRSNAMALKAYVQDDGVLYDQDEHNDSES
jgi:hypothetical protein